MMKYPTSLDHVAPGTSENIVDFAQRQIFASVAAIEPLPAGTPPRSLQRVLCNLLDSEINAGLQTFAFDSFRIWFGDELNGIHARVELRPDDPAWGDDAAVAHWLHETAIGLYPQSEYARKHR